MSDKYVQKITLLAVIIAAVCFFVVCFICFHNQTTLFTSSETAVYKTLQADLENAGLKKSNAKNSAKILEDIGVSDIKNVEDLCTEGQKILEITSTDGNKYLLKYDDKGELSTVTETPPKGKLLYRKR